MNLKHQKHRWTSDRKVAGSNPRLPWGRTELHVEVSLSKILNPRTAPDVQLAACGAASAISKAYMFCVQTLQKLQLFDVVKM